MELESALSETANNSESSQNTLNMLQEIRQKDSTLKKIQKKHNDTLLAVKKEVEKQVHHFTSLHYMCRLDLSFGNGVNPPLPAHEDLSL